jgi:hypothetical protein
MSSLLENKLTVDASEVSGLQTSGAVARMGGYQPSVVNTEVKGGRRRRRSSRKGSKKKRGSRRRRSMKSWFKM